MNKKTIKEEIVMSNITTTINPNINLIDDYYPPTAEHVCFWSTDHERWAEIKRSEISPKIRKDHATGNNFLVVHNPITNRETRVNIKELSFQIGSSINRSKKLANIRSNYHG